MARLKEKISALLKYLARILIEIISYYKAAWIESSLTKKKIEEWIGIISKVVIYTTKVSEFSSKAILTNSLLLMSFTQLVVDKVSAIV